MIIGLISDTHSSGLGSIFGLVEERFAEVEEIFHLGDCTEPLVIEDLETIAPVTVVRGNNDFEGFEDVPLHVVRERKGLRFGLIHGRSHGAGVPAWCRKHFPEPVDIIFHGHSHIANAERINDVWVVNPGSAHRARDGRGKSLALLHLGEEVIVEHLFLANGERKKTVLTGLAVAP